MGEDPPFQTAPSYFFTQSTLNLSVKEALGVVFLLWPPISQSLTSEQKWGARVPTGEQPMGDGSFLFILFFSFKKIIFIDSFLSIYKSNL